MSLQKLLRPSADVLALVLAGSPASYHFEVAERFVESLRSVPRDRANDRLGLGK